MPAANFKSPKWSKDEYERMEYLYSKTNTPLAEIAKLMGRSVRAIQNKRDMRGIPSRLELRK